MYGRNFHNILLIMALCVLSAVAAAGESQTDYMAILMQGQKIGYASHTRTVENSHVISTEQFSLTLGRGGQAVTVESREMYIETVDAKPLSFEMGMKASGVEQKTSGTIENGKINLTRHVMGTPQTSIVDWPAGALMPEGMLLLQKEKGLDPGTEYEFLIFRPDMMMSINTTVIVGEKQPIDLFGRVAELTEVKQITRVQDQEIIVTSYVDDDFKALKSVAPTMGMTLEFVACDKDFAMQPNNVIDFLEKLSIASPTPLTEMNAISSIDYKLVSTTDQPLQIPTTSHQQARAQNGSTLVTVQQLPVPENIPFPYEGTDPNILECLKSTEYLQSDKEAIIDLARHAVGGTQDAAKAAKQIESFVAGYIQTKDLSVGYASAAEVAQSRQGDCSEHAVLTAAMCRAVGIPARIACGVVYAEAFINQKNIFAGHMWVEAWLNGRWVGLDATHPSPNDSGFGFTPGHITLATGNGSPKDFFNLVNILGCFKIEKITIYRSETTQVKAAQTP